MIVSVNWLRKFTEIDLPISELTTLIGARIVEIEEVIDLGKKYQDVIVAKVVEAVPVPDSDHLNLCKIDDGGKCSNVERDENGLIQVVCGAPNVRAGLLVAWLPPQSIVPETFGSADPFVLGSRKLRGFMSNGMIASPRELDLYDEHEGILEIDISAEPGDSFAKLYELDDYLLDIENKSLTHRPDCFGLIGLAREISAVQGKKFESPAWYMSLEPILGAKTGNLTAPTVRISDPAICQRYEAIVLSAVKPAVESPVLIKSYLSRSGMRPISAAVDITNYLMLVTGQPLHAFDYDKLIKVSSTGKPDITVRTADNGEKMTLLDGREIVMTDDDIVIAAGNTPVALAGAMGGAETEIDGNTKNILLESATFDLYKLRNTQFRHGIFSEAITRFTKGQPAALTAPVLASAARMFVGQTGAEIASDIIDCYPSEKTPSPVKVSAIDAAELLGQACSKSEFQTTLTNIGYEIAQENADEFTPPWWRTDIHIKEDVIEDFGRINGFDNITPILPKRDFKAIRPSVATKLTQKLRDILAGAGANEVLSYSFVHGDLLKKVGQDLDNSYRIINAISPDLQYYRQSLTPSLLEKTYMNIDSGFTDFALFELNKVHQKQTYGLNEEKTPIEKTKLAMVLMSSHDDNPYYLAKKYVDLLLERLGIEANYVAIESENAENQPYEKKRSAEIQLAKDKKVCLGVVGEIKSSVRKSFKLPKTIAGFELNTDQILEHLPTHGVDYKVHSRYPSAKRDMTFQVDVELEHARLMVLIQKTLAESGLQFQIEPTSIYQSDDKITKNLTFHISLASMDKTLSSNEIGQIIDKIAVSAKESLNAKII